jgi:hypothetical protein
MAAADRIYRRLPGRHRGFLNSATLWSGPDHLLLAEVHFWTERYRRFYYRDIQSIVLGRSSRWIGVAALLLVPILLFGGFAASAQGGLRIFWLIVLSLFVVGEIVNLIRGPSCNCDLKTPLETVRLKPLGRLRPSRRALRLLRPLVEQAQGTAAPAAEILEQARFVPEAPAAPPPLPLVAVPPPLLKPGRPGAHVVLAGVLALDAFITVLQWPDGGWLINTVASVVFLACVVAALVAIISQARTDLGAPFAWFARTALGVQVVLYTLMSGFAFTEMFRRAQAGHPPQFALTASLRTVGPIEIAVQSAMAVWGMVLYLGWRRAQRPAWIDLKI